MPADDSLVFRAFLEAAHDNIYVIGRDFRYMHVSRGATRVLGRAPEEMIGKTWQELGLPPATMTERESEWRLVFETGETTRRDVAFDTPSGRRHYESVLFPIRSGSEIIAVAAISRDVTDRVLAEAELRRAEDRYRSFIAHSSEGIWRFELDEPIAANLPVEEQVRLIFERAYLAECNETVARMYGFERTEDIVGVRLTQLMDPKEEANWEYLRAFVRSGARLDNAESVEFDRYGRRKYFVNSLTGVIENGFFLRAWGMQRDVTERRAATDRLRLSEERLQALVQASEQIVWTTDAKGGLEWISPSWTETTSQTPREAKGQGWLEAVHPDDHEKAAQQWQQAVASSRLYDADLRLKMADGSYRWFHVRAAPVFNEDGSVREWIGASNDIDAERRQAAMAAADQLRVEFIAAANDLFVRSLDYEETLRSLAQLAVPRLADWCAVDMVEADGSLRRLAVEHIDREKVKLAYELQEQYPTDVSTSQGVGRVMMTGQTEFMNEIPDELIRASARSPEHLELIRKLQLRSYIATAIRVRENIAGVLTLVNAESGRTFDNRDVELAEALALRAGHAIENARLYQQSLEANRAKDDFLATLSHELRTPLTAILGWANLLRLSNYERDTMRTAVDTIERSAKTQASIIDDLLDVSRIITGKFQITPESVDIVPIVRNVVDSARPAAEGKRIAIEVDAPPSLTIRADPNRLQQIVWNLTSNAVKFSNEGGTISVAVSKNDDEAVISVCDEGAGLPPDVLPRVFDRFWQADSSSNRAHGGLGLGLAIVKHLVEMHGGNVSAKSDGPGKGATFTIRLPAAEIPAAGRPDASGPHSTTKRVLLVDDDESARVVIARILEHYGARVTETSNAPDALERALAEAYDLVITDIAMPGHDGYWLLKQLREKQPNTPVAAVTALGVAEDELNGFDAFVRKPVEPRELAALLDD